MSETPSNAPEKNKVIAEEQDRRRKSKTRTRSQNLDNVDTVMLCYRIELDRATKIKEHQFRNNLTNDEFIDDALKAMGF